MKTVKPLPISLPDGACNEAFTLRSAARSSDRPLAAVTTKELWNELPNRGRIDFSRLQPFIRSAMLVLIFAAVTVGYWGMNRD